MVSIDNAGAIKTFNEKPLDDSGWINGGFFVLEPEVLDLIEDDKTIWEQGPMGHLTQSDELRAYRHHGFWHAMDHLRDKLILDDLWESGQAAWKVWS